MMNNHLCVGCGLCSSLYPDNFNLEMKNGFYRPSMLKSPDQKTADLLKKVCPAYLGRPNLSTDDKLLECSEPPFFGHSALTILTHSTNDTLRNKAASGGALSAVLIHLLASKKIDAVMHIGIDNENPFLNRVKISRNADEILVNSGSRYAPAASLSQIHELLNSTERFAFVGKPCEVATLRSLVHNNPNYEGKVAYYLSFFCAGTPNLNKVKAMASYLGLKAEDVTEIKYRGDGWPGTFSMCTSDGTIKEMSYDQSWGKYLGRSIQDRCKLCFDGIGESADISFGDAWYLTELETPDFSERPGRNVAIARNITGKTVLLDAIEAGQLHLDEVLDTDLIIGKMQRYQYERRGLVVPRMKAFRLAGVGSLSYPQTLYKRYAAVFTFKKKTKQFLGTLYRLSNSK